MSIISRYRVAQRDKRALRRTSELEFANTDGIA